MVRSVNSVTAFEAKTRLGRLLDRVQAGEELLITRHGEPVAKLVPIANQKSERIEAALSTFQKIRDEMASKGKKISRREICQWINQGRR